MRTARALVITLIVVSVAGCARYERRPLAFKSPAAYANHQTVEGVSLGAQKLADRREARQVFGFDIIRAEVLPVQVVIDNESGDPFSIVPEQSFIEMPDGRMYPLLRPDMARQRIEESTGWGEIAPGAGRGAILGGAAGTVLGAAVGVVTGRNVLEAAGKGAVVGGAGGAVLGGAEGATSEEVSREIAQDLHHATLQNKVVRPNAVGHGVLFFPGEAGAATGLKLRIKNEDTAEVHDLRFGL
ncbi:MAG: hypothetical protein ACOC7T_00350 [Planctomycetota bacterium]